MNKGTYDICFILFDIKSLNHLYISGRLVYKCMIENFNFNPQSKSYGYGNDISNRSSSSDTKYQKAKNKSYTRCQGVNHWLVHRALEQKHIIFLK